jgi:hypothetical protein
MNQTYLDTARLLTQVAPLVFVDDTFALKGRSANEKRFQSSGTALTVEAPTAPAFVFAAVRVCQVPAWVSRFVAAADTGL